MAGAPRREIVGGYGLNPSLPLRQVLRVVSFRLTRGPIRPGNLAQVVDRAGVEQIRKMHHEVSLLPHHTNHDSLVVLLDLDRGTTRKCSRVGGADWDGHDRLRQRIRAAHRPMPSARIRPSAIGGIASGYSTPGYQALHAVLGFKQKPYAATPRTRRGITDRFHTVRDRFSNTSINTTNALKSLA
jgi:hypothetical protein